MSQTFWVENGDTKFDDFGRIVLISGKDLLKQHTRELIYSSLSRDDIVSIDDSFLAEAFLNIRLVSQLETLKRLLDNSGIYRDESERIYEIALVLVKRSKIDKRMIRFWVQLKSLAGVIEEGGVIL